MLNSKPKNFSDLVDGDILYIVSTKARSDIDFQEIYEVPFISLNHLIDSALCFWYLTVESKDLPDKFFEDLEGIVANRSDNETKFVALISEDNINLPTMIYGQGSNDNQTIITTSREVALEWCKKKYNRIIDEYYDKIESYFGRIEELEDLFERWKKKNCLQV